jgi:hypothetical protein
MLLCRRRRAKKTITADHGGFAGVRSSANQSPPADIRSSELSSLAQLFSDEGTLIGADIQKTTIG